MPKAERRPFIQVVEFFTKVSKATQELEPAAEIYRWYKVDGKDEFVYIEKYVQVVLLITYPPADVISEEKDEPQPGHLWGVSIPLLGCC